MRRARIPGGSASNGPGSLVQHPDREALLLLLVLVLAVGTELAPPLLVDPELPLDVLGRGGQVLRLRRREEVEGRRVARPVGVLLHHPCLALAVEGEVDELERDLLVLRALDHAPVVRSQLPLVVVDVDRRAGTLRGDPARTD